MCVSSFLKIKLTQWTVSRDSYQCNWLSTMSPFYQHGSTGIMMLKYNYTCIFYVRCNYLYKPKSQWLFNYINIRVKEWRSNYIPTTLQWRHNGCDSVSNHQPHDCLLNCLFRRRSKKTSKLRVTGLCARNSPVAGEFPAQMASNAENVSIWWRHHDFTCSHTSSNPDADLVDLCLQNGSRASIYYVGKTSYRQISWNFEFARSDVKIIVSLLNLTGIQIAEWLEKSKPKSRGFETSRDRAIRRLTV